MWVAKGNGVSVLLTARLVQQPHLQPSLQQASVVSNRNVFPHVSVQILH